MGDSLKTEPSLQMIAAARVAVSLWNHINDVPNSNWQKPEYLSELRDSCLQLAEKISLPRSVNALIEKFVVKVHAESKIWVSYHYQWIYYYHESDSGSCRLICHFPYFAWNHDCTIDCKKTAQNLQNSISLSEVEKFRFLCLYCLKDEIEQKWKLLVQNKVIGSVPFNNNPLIHYWRYYCQNKLQDIPITEGLTLDEFMFRNDGVSNWPAKEYFFDRMNVDEQIQSAMWIVDRKNEIRCQKFIIMKMNQSQRYTLYVNRSVEILLNYAKNPTDYVEILPLWFEVAEMISEEDFVKLLKGLLMRKVSNPIISQIWISASDKLKLRVLNYKNDEFVLNVWDLWTQFYDDSFKMVLEMSSSIRAEVLKTKMFSDHCELLLRRSKFSMLERVLNFCFPKHEELVSIKRQLSQLAFFTDSLMNYMRNNEPSALKHVFDFFSDVIDLNKMKKHIVIIPSFKNNCRKLIEDGRLPDLNELLNFFFNPEQTKKSWRDFFDDTFFISCCKNLIFSNKGSVLDELLGCFNYTAEESTQFKRDFSKTEIFNDRYQDLISNNRLSILEAALKSLFPCVDELVRFKGVLSRRKFVIDHCQDLIEENRLTQLDELSSFLFLSVEESQEFKQNFTTKKFFDDICDDLIKSDEFSELETLLKSFYPNAKELVRFKLRLTKKKAFVDHCQQLMKINGLERLKNLLQSSMFSSVEEVAQFKQNFPKKKLFDVCHDLIIPHALSTLSDLLELFFPSVEESISFKKILVGSTSFRRHCENLIDSGSFSILDELLKLCFPNERDLNQFKNQLAESSFIKERVLHLCTAENFEKLNDLLSALFQPRSDLIYEIKRNFLLSEEGFGISLKLAEKSKTVWDNFICDCLPSSTSLANFKKEIIFSPVAISHLKKLMLKNILCDVKICLNWFLSSTADKNALKMKLLDNAVEFFTMLFFKTDKFTCQTKIKWWLPDKTAAEECKRKLSVDEVFEAGIKTCIFETLDRQYRVSRCIFKKDANFESLDWFLKWYFESSKEVKEFKLRKIQDYESMATICILLMKGCRYLYFKQLLDWFFENDVVEMAKFKKKHKGEKIASMM